MVYYIGYPRSATGLFTFLVECYVGRPLVTLGNSSTLNNLIIKSNYKLPQYIDFDYKRDKIAIKHHYGSAFINCAVTGKLILCLRNPIENVLSYVYSSSYSNMCIEEFCSISDKNSLISQGVNKYNSNIDFYNNWGGDKMIYYYEDFISNLKINLVRFINFMDIEPLNDKVLYNLSYLSDVFYDFKKSSKSLKCNTANDTTNKLFTNKLSDLQIEHFKCLFVDEKLKVYFK